MYKELLVENMGAFGRLEWSGHAPVNILVGENDTGKTHLLKLLYAVARSVYETTQRAKTDQPRWSEVLAQKLLAVYEPRGWRLGELVAKGEKGLKVECSVGAQHLYFAFGRDTRNTISQCTELVGACVAAAPLFLPPKEILTALDAIAATKEQLAIPGFDETYQDLVTALRQPPSRGRVQHDLQSALDTLEELLHGEIRREGNEFIYKKGNQLFAMAQTAEGVKKIGILSTLIRNRALTAGGMLFVDEPEANLHPRAIVAFVGMLLALSDAGIQVYLATHSYAVLKELELQARPRAEGQVAVNSLARNDTGVHATCSDLHQGMPDNAVVSVAAEQYLRDVGLSEVQGVKRPAVVVDDW
jgi:energy-coupling factor transporter ATP-binding protein EcfA2